MNLAHLSVFAAAVDSPDVIALSLEEKEVSFRELAFDVRKMTLKLKKLFASSLGDDVYGPIAWVADQHYETFTLMYALMEMGIPLVPIHMHLAPIEMERQVRVSGALCLVSPKNLLFINKDAEKKRKQDLDPDGLAILFTSGSSGKAKGVELGRLACLAASRSSYENLGWLEHDRWLLGLSYAHVGGLATVLRCLIARKTLVIGKWSRFESEAVLECIERKRVTLCSLVPTQLSRLIEYRAKLAPTSLRAVLIGGAPLPKVLMQASLDTFWPIFPTYGLTEAWSQVATQSYGEKVSFEKGAGKPLSCVEVRVVSDVIELRGASLFKAYLDETGRHPIKAFEWFQTGDLGYMDEKACLHVLGRKDEMILTGGEKVSPSEVESALLECGDVTAAFVFGLADPEWGELVAAAVLALEPDEHRLRSKLKRKLSQKMASYKHPKRWFYFSEFLFLPNGKLDRKKMKERCLSQMDAGFDLSVQRGD